MESHDHHSPFAIDIHLSSVTSVFPKTNCHDGCRAWHSHLVRSGGDSASRRTQEGSPPWTDASSKAIPARKGLAAQGIGVKGDVAYHGLLLSVCLPPAECGQRYYGARWWKGSTDAEFLPLILVAPWGLPSHDCTGKPWPGSLPYREFNAFTNSLSERWGAHPGSDKHCSRCLYPAVNQTQSLASRALLGEFFGRKE